MRLRTDEAGTGQEKAVRGIRLARKLVKRGATISIGWVLGHAGVQGNEVADMWATEAAAREERVMSGRKQRNNTARGSRSLTFLKTQIKKKAVKEWRQETIERCQGKVFQDPGGRRTTEDTSRPTESSQGTGIPILSAGLWTRYGGPLLEGKFGWVESDGCWWCGEGRKSRDHLFKECKTWKEEIRRLWKEVGKISGPGRNKAGGGVYRDAEVFVLECVGLCLDQGTHR